MIQGIVLENIETHSYLKIDFQYNAAIRKEVMIIGESGSQKSLVFELMRVFLETVDPQLLPYGVSLDEALAALIADPRREARITWRFFLSRTEYAYTLKFNSKGELLEELLTFSTTSAKGILLQSGLKPQDRQVSELQRAMKGDSLALDLKPMDRGRVRSFCEFIQRLVVINHGHWFQVEGVQSRSRLRLQEGFVKPGQLPLIMQYEAIMNGFLQEIAPSSLIVHYSFTHRRQQIYYALTVRQGYRHLTVLIEQLALIVEALLSLHDDYVIFYDALDLRVDQFLLQAILELFTAWNKTQFVFSVQTPALLKSMRPQNVLFAYADGERFVMRWLHSILKTQANNNNQVRYERGNFHPVEVVVRSSVLKSLTEWVELYHTLNGN